MILNRDMRERIQRVINRTPNIDTTLVFDYDHIVAGRHGMRLEDEVRCLGETDRLQPKAHEGLQELTPNIYSIRTTYMDLLDMLEDPAVVYVEKQPEAFTPEPR